MKDIVKCPHCGKSSVLYSNEYVKYQQYYNYNGEHCGYSDYEHTDKRKSTPLYCLECGKKVATLDEL